MSGHLTTEAASVNALVPGRRLADVRGVAWCAHRPSVVRCPEQECSVKTSCGAGVRGIVGRFRAAEAGTGRCARRPRIDRHGIEAFRDRLSVAALQH